MKKTLSLILFVLITCGAVFADQPSYLPPYYQQADFLATTPGVAGDAAGAFFNPAVRGMMKGFDLQFFWSDLDREPWEMKNWALLTGCKGLGFGVQGWDYGDPLVGGTYKKRSLTDYNLSLGFGDDANAFGFGYSWSKGSVPQIYPRDNTFSLGYLARPSRYVSCGAAGHYALKKHDMRGIFDLGVRPLGDPRLTVFGDAAWVDYQRLSDVQWGAGLAVEPVPGIALQGKYFEDESFQFGISLSLGSEGISTITHYNKEAARTYNTHSVRFGSTKPSLINSTLLEDKLYLKMKFNDRVKYQKYLLFDSGKILTGVLETLEEAKKDERVAGVALYITEEMSGSWELIWEIREKLKEVRAAGKKVVVFLERGEMRHYYLASAADKVMVDPEGMVIMMGFNMGRTFYRNLADKLGVGIDEWRYFKYKSAAESFSRTSMSEADKEQRKALIDDWYDIVRADICESRGLTENEFDHIVNEVPILVSDSLIAYNLADTTGRWPDMSDWIKSIEGEKKWMVSEKGYSAMLYEEVEWGIPPRIAVIYAVGECALNSGINARRLQKVIKKAREDDRIKAVVFRADSPGGDALPSDIVAVELKKTSEEKPVIVSQGWVAASGGYWISMTGDKIVASPWTITGSIGVIGGWIYNNGLGDKIGLTYDHTQVGRHADLGSGIRLPLIGLQIPERNLTMEERGFVEKMFRALYREFIKKVAEGRNMTPEVVEEIAQGRVWTGIKGKENGLVDELGGLEKAVDLARQAAGIESERRIEIVEMPGRGLINPQMFQPKLIGLKGPLFTQGAEDPELMYLRMILQAKGRPLVMIPPEFYMLDDYGF